MNDAPAYGTTRERSPNVTYGEIERAAIGILKDGRRPTVENVRETLGRGAPATIADSLKRFWRDLGAKAEGDPAALTRMPAERCFGCSSAIAPPTLSGKRGSRIWRPSSKPIGGSSPQ